MVHQKHIIFLCSIATYGKTHKLVFCGRQIFLFFIFSLLIYCSKSLQRNPRSVTLFACQVLGDLGSSTWHRSEKSSPTLVCWEPRETTSMYPTLVWLSSVSQLLCSCQLCCYPGTWTPVFLGQQFSCIVNTLDFILILSLSQQQYKTSVGGCGTVWAWPDHVTWNTGREHKQKHCSLKKKLGKSNVALLRWLRTGMRDPIIVHSV